MGRQQTKCHGAEGRFEAVAEFIYGRFGRSIRYIADVAGGQGMLARILTKKYNYQCEVIDPRGFVLKGVANRQTEYTADMAGYYDLVVGLHPDEATRPVVESAKTTPILVVPCCNFWDTTRRLGTKALVEEIETYLTGEGIPFEEVTFPFKGPKNVGILTRLG